MNVRKLQHWLNVFFKENLKEDGIWGNNTETATNRAKLKMFMTSFSDRAFYRKLSFFMDNYNKFYYVFEELKEDIKNFKIISCLDFDSLILISQFCLETGYLEKVIPGTYNLGNIKAKNSEDYTEVNTREYDKKGDEYFEMAKFKKYNSYFEFLMDYKNLIANNNRYKKALCNLKNPYMYFKGLSEGGYATDPKYVELCLQIYNNLWTFERVFYQKETKFKEGGI